MRKQTTKQRLLDVVEGRMDIEELTEKELRKLEEFTFQAVAAQYADRLAPSTDTKH